MVQMSRFIDRALDWRYGIDTSGVFETNLSDDSCHASTVPYRDIDKMLDRLDLKPADVFIDIGCGKGRVLALAALRAIELAIGIDASSAMVSKAAENCRRMGGRLRSPVEVHLSFAETYDYGACSAGYCFNSFGWRTLGPVLDKIRQDRGKSPFRLCFLNPSPEQMNVFAVQGWTLSHMGVAAEMPFVVMQLTRKGDDAT
ncbi:MAG TPA: class I SAM-dependent methyltransferase [Rhizobiaceae bacterium]|nr:class I SAM-dependent methyltransferase [Rhizobiaceae bacterium]